MRGRYSWSYRHTVEQCKIIDISWLSRHGYLCEFKAGGIEWRDSTGELTGSISIEVSVPEISSDTGYLRFMYAMTDRMTEEKTRHDYTVDLVTTPCTFGGFRYWFICPLVVNGRPCQRRVAKLYLPPGDDYFGCRHCHNLTYRCQKEHNKQMDIFRKSLALLLRR